jgi:hypothetical protein
LREFKNDRSSRPNRQLAVFMLLRIWLITSLAGLRVAGTALVIRRFSG